MSHTSISSSTSFHLNNRSINEQHLAAVWDCIFSIWLSIVKWWEKIKFNEEQNIPFNQSCFDFFDFFLIVEEYYQSQIDRSIFQWLINGMMVIIVHLLFNLLSSVKCRILMLKRTRILGEILIGLKHFSCHRRSDDQLRRLSRNRQRLVKEFCSDYFVFHVDLLCLLKYRSWSSSTLNSNKIFVTIIHPYRHLLSSLAILADSLR